MPGPPPHHPTPQSPGPPPASPAALVLLVVVHEGGFWPSQASVRETRLRTEVCVCGEADINSSVVPQNVKMYLITIQPYIYF